MLREHLGALFPEPHLRACPILTPWPVLCFPGCCLFPFLLRGQLRHLFLWPCSPSCTVVAHSYCPRLFWSCVCPWDRLWVAGSLAPHPLPDGHETLSWGSKRSVISLLEREVIPKKNAVPLTPGPQSRSGNINKATYGLGNWAQITSKVSAFLCLSSAAHMSQQKFEASQYGQCTKAWGLCRTSGERYSWVSCALGTSDCWHSMWLC